MKKRGWGRIINIASAHGLVGSIHKAAYVAAKHGLVGLTKVAGLEAAGTGVTVNAICPGWVRTPLVDKQIADLATQKRISQADAAIGILGEKQPSRTFVTPEQLGGTVAFLCSAGSRSDHRQLPWPSMAPGPPSSGRQPIQDPPTANQQSVKDRQT